VQIVAVTATSAEPTGLAFGEQGKSGVEEQRSQGQVQSESQPAAQGESAEPSPQDATPQATPTPDIEARIAALETESRKWQSTADQRDAARRAAESRALIAEAKLEQANARLKENDIDVDPRDAELAQYRAQERARQAEANSGSVERYVRDTIVREKAGFKDDADLDLGLDAASADEWAERFIPTAVAKARAEGRAEAQAEITSLKAELEALSPYREQARLQDARTMRPSGGRGGPDLSTMSGLAKAMADGLWGPNDDGQTYTQSVSRDEFDKVMAAARNKALGFG
jgi:hypothetical protein